MLVRLVKHDLNSPLDGTDGPAPQRTHFLARSGAGRKPTQYSLVGFKVLPIWESHQDVANVTTQHADVEVGMDPAGLVEKEIERPATGEPPWRSNVGKPSDSLTGLDREPRTQLVLAYLLHVEWVCCESRRSGYRHD